MYNSPSYNNIPTQGKYMPENLKISQQLPNGGYALNGEAPSARVNEYAQRYSKKDETEQKGNNKNVQ